jgi:uncharacterized membrane protein
LIGEKGWLHLRRSESLAIALLLVCVVLHLLPIWVFGFVDNGDWHVHWFRLSGFSQSLAEGVWRPLWHADANAGYGAPTFLYYPPLVYYLASAPVLLGASIAQAWLFTYSLIMLIAALGGYCLFRRWVTPGWAVILALGFALSPPVALVLHQFHMVANALALSLLPWLMLALIFDFQRQLPRVVSVALISSTLVISHPLIAIQGVLIGLGVSFAYLAVGDRSAAIGLLLGGLLGGLVSMGYWWPVLELRHLVHWEYFLNPAWGWENNLLFSRPDRQVGAFHATRPLFDLIALIGLLGALVAAGFALNGSSARRRALVLGLLSCSVFIVLISSPLGVWVIDLIPALGYLQFAWRWLGALWLLMLVLWAIFMGSNEAGATSVRSRRVATAFAGVVVAFIATASFAIGSGKGPLGVFGLSEDRITEAKGASALEEEYWPTLEMRPKSFTGRLGTDLSRDPLPLVWSRQAGVRITELDGGQHWVRFRYTSERRSQVRLRVFNFPGWSASLLGGDQTDALVIESEPESGAVVIDLPAGGGEVELRFAGPY